MAGGDEVKSYVEADESRGRATNSAKSKERG